MRNFSDLPREVRLMVNRLLPLDEEFVFDLEECQQNDNQIDAENPKFAGLYDLIREFRDFARFFIWCSFLLLSSAAVSKTKYFERNNITHLGKFTCDYETCNLYDDTGAASARGRIEVSVDLRRNVTVTGDAECDDTSYDETNCSDGVGLISWQLMDHINASLEDDIEDLRRHSGDDEKDSDEEDETEAQDDEDEDEDQVDSDENDSDEQESE
ncbi:hypothetical protein KCV07_g7122, partial [Aureobasidium melanogenum]